MTQFCACLRADTHLLHLTSVLHFFNDYKNFTHLRGHLLLAYSALATPLVVTSGCLWSLKFLNASFCTSSFPRVAFWFAGNITEPAPASVNQRWYKPDLPRWNFSLEMLTFTQESMTNIVSLFASVHISLYSGVEPVGDGSMMQDTVNGCSWQKFWWNVQL